MSDNSDISVLIVNRKRSVKKELEELTAFRGYECHIASTVSETAEILTMRKVDIIVTDIHLEDGCAFDIINNIDSSKSLINTIVLTESPSTEDAIRALKAGAYDLITSHIDAESYYFALKRASENIRLKRENSRSYEELIKLNRLKNEFLSVVSHDLRSPLSSIAGYVNYMIKKGGLTDLQVRYLNVIKEITNDLYSLVNELLDISKIETGIISLNKAPTDIVNLINLSINSFILLGIDKNTRIDFFNNIDDPIVSVDRMKLLQVINNIISNSIKFTENGIITVNASRSAGMIRISISDTGKGMEREQIDRLFDQYNYLHSVGTRGERGNGLGLVICKKFIDLHGGRIEISSKAGQGTTFHISLPE